MLRSILFNDADAADSAVLNQQHVRTRTAAAMPCRRGYTEHAALLGTVETICLIREHRVENTVTVCTLWGLHGSAMSFWGDRWGDNIR
jgi:hypothetical protein